MNGTSEKKVILQLRKLKKNFPIKRGVLLRALNDVSFSIYEGEKFGVVGESGCGKSTLGRVILQLYKQTSGSCVYYGKSFEDINPAYVKKEIAKLPEYQKKAGEFYNESVKIDLKISELESQKASFDAEGNSKDAKKQDKISKKIDLLSYKSKELKKNASRQLREGSRTVGSLILCKNIKEIQTLFEQSYAHTTKVHNLLEEMKKADANYQESIVESATPKTEASRKKSASLKSKLTQLEENAAKNREKARELRTQAFAYRNTNILPITELTNQQEYRDKLDNNYESGINLSKLTNHEMRPIRKEMQMIFQDPAASLDPRQSIGSAIEEVFKINSEYSRDVRREKTMELLEKVGLKREYYYSFPHVLSGGQKQRVGIARAIALNTNFVVLDEAVSALDVSVQAQVLQLLQDLSDEYHLTYFFITHDLGVVKHFCDRILVMYLGNTCELGNSKDLFSTPLHPYTKSLLASVPRPTVHRDREMDEILQGEVPSATNPPKGCPFHTRCTSCMDVCRSVRPTYTEALPNHFVACHLFSSQGENQS